MSFFITFEGIEGCGKTTQIRLLSDYLRQCGHEVVLTREPGGCPISDIIRSILLNPENAAMVPKTELLLYAAARAQHVEEVILPALEKGQFVLCDRFTDATLAYQGFGRGLDIALIDELNRLAAGSLVPHLTFLLDMPVQIGLERARERNSSPGLSHEDRFEREALDFHRRVREGYLHHARRHSRFRIIEAQGAVTEVHARIREVLEKERLELAP